MVSKPSKVVQDFFQQTGGFLNFWSDVSKLIWFWIGFSVRRGCYNLATPHDSGHIWNIQIGLCTKLKCLMPWTKPWTHFLTPRETVHAAAQWVRRWIPNGHHGCFNTGCLGFGLALVYRTATHMRTWGFRLTSPTQKEGVAKAKRGTNLLISHRSQKRMQWPTRTGKSNQPPLEVNGGHCGCSSAVFWRG